MSRLQHLPEPPLDVGDHLEVARAQEDAPGQTVTQRHGLEDAVTHHHPRVPGEEAGGQQGEEQGRQEDDGAEDQLEHGHRLHRDTRGGQHRGGDSVEVLKQ